MGMRGPGWLQREPSDTPSDGPGHSDAGLGADTHVGSGSEQRNTATRSVTQGFGEALGFGLTHKHLPCRQSHKSMMGQGPATPQPGDEGIMPWKAKLLLWGNRAVSTQHC